MVEGIKLVDGRAFSVQYHPEAAAGPHDAKYLFDQFVDLMAGQQVSRLPPRACVSCRDTPPLAVRLRTLAHGRGH